MGFLGDVFSGIGDALSSGLSMVLEGVSGVARVIGDGIKSLCESVGSEGLALIGCIAIAILVPGFGVPELLALIQCVAEVAKILGVDTGEDSPEELGMKTEIAEKKPEDFDRIQEYIKYLNNDVELEEGATENLTDVEKAKYGAMGAALNIRALEEKYDINLSPDFLRDITIMKLSSQEVASFIEDFKDKGIDKMQEMTDYLRDKSTEMDKSVISGSMLETMSKLYPELSSDELEIRLSEMKAELVTE